jgi:2'-5' RNA ligase
MTNNESLYFLAIIPPKNICEEVFRFKRIAHEKFGSKASLNSPAHITLHMPFKWKQKKEGTLVDKLKQFKFDSYPISIGLNGFEFFEPRVIFIDLLENESIRRLQKELSAYIRKSLNVFNADYKDRVFHPHITVAFRDLKKPVFPEAKAFFSSKAYEKKFDANQFCLLKHDGSNWQEFMSFPFIG